MEICSTAYAWDYINTAFISVHMISCSLHDTSENSWHYGTKETSIGIWLIFQITFLFTFVLSFRCHSSTSLISISLNNKVNSDFVTIIKHLISIVDCIGVFTANRKCDNCTVFSIHIHWYEQLFQCISDNRVKTHKYVAQPD